PTSAMNRFPQRKALSDVLHARLLAVNVFARIGRQRRGDGVPVRASSDQHRVDIAASQKIAQVTIGRTIGITVFIIRLFLDGFSPRVFYITDSDEPYVRFLQKAAEDVGATVADANRAHHNLFTGRRGAL